MPHTLAALDQFVAGLPRLPLGEFPTPLVRLERLSDRLGVDLWMKRDDCSGLALGGNKTRKLEFVLDTIYTAKAFWSPVQMIERGAIARGRRVLFVHTGGLSMAAAGEKRWADQDFRLSVAPAGLSETPAP